MFSPPRWFTISSHSCCLYYPCLCKLADINSVISDPPALFFFLKGAKIPVPPFLRGARACFQTSLSDLDPPKSRLKRGTLTKFSPLDQGGWGGSNGLRTSNRGIESIQH